MTVSPLMDAKTSEAVSKQEQPTDDSAGDKQRAKEVVWGISVWPLFGLNALAFSIIALVCGVLFLTLESQGLSAFEVRLIVGYFLGIGALIAIAGGVFGWLGGPEVVLSADGIEVRTTWLMDKTFPERRVFTIGWSDIAVVDKVRFWTMGYLRLKRFDGKPAFYLPLFVAKRRRFLNSLLSLLPDKHPLKPFVQQ